MAEIQSALTLAAEEKAVSVMCLRCVLLFIEEVICFQTAKCIMNNMSENVVARSNSML